MTIRLWVSDSELTEYTGMSCIRLS